MKKLTWIISVIVIVVLISIAFILRQNNSGDKDKNGYDTYEVKKENPINLEGKATPKSIKMYNNNDQIGSYISTSVNDGQTVKQGEPLINYDINNNKRKQLLDKLNATEDAYAKAEAQQELNKYDRTVYDSIYASFDGKVDIKNKNDVSAGEPILQLISKELQVKATISEFDVSKIKEGNDVDLSITSTGETAKGKIAKISELPKSFEDAGSKASGGEGGEAPSSNVINDPSSGNSDESSKYTIVINDIDIPVRSGYSMEVKVPVDTIKIPKSVLAKDNHVFVVGKDNKIEKRHIKIDKVNGEIIVKDGLKKGEKLIKHPKKNMNNGDKVEVSS